MKMRFNDLAYIKLCNRRKFNQASYFPYFIYIKGQQIIALWLKPSYHLCL